MAFVGPERSGGPPLTREKAKVGRKPAHFNEAGRKLAATYTPERCADILMEDSVGLLKMMLIAQGKGKTRRKKPKVPTSTRNALAKVVQQYD